MACRLRRRRHSGRRGRRPVAPCRHQQHESRQRLWAMADLPHAIGAKNTDLDVGYSDLRPGSRSNEGPVWGRDEIRICFATQRQRQWQLPIQRTCALPRHCSAIAPSRRPRDTIATRAPWTLIAPLWTSFLPGVEIDERLPQAATPEEFDVLVYDQKLGGLQAHELGLVLYHVDEDLREYRKRREGRKPRRELVRRLKRLAKSLGDLEFELYRWRQTINDFLPADTQEEIGMLMSFSALEAALKREIRTPELGSVIENLLSECPDFRIAQLEDQLLTRRQARGLEHGGELLMHFVERINQPIKTWIELDRCNRGGRPTKNVARDFLLFRTRGGCSSRHRQKTHSHGGWPLCSALRGRGRRLRIRSSGDRACGGKSDKGAVQAK